MQKIKIWHLYIIRCADSTLYTGISCDVGRRFARHVSGRGAKYTRTRGPLQLVYTKKIGSQGDALKKEYQIKRLSKKKKEELVRKHQGRPRRRISA
ncbi:MAG: GIY-YIG nuclease family protein [Chitinispirillaceae bacterium]|jgi:putative endonuclease|nr:GIY-YIG nuclease family protein [Chitinispirillaceae bacterium]